MLETVGFTDDEREALQGDRDAITALAKGLAKTPPPAGPTPAELGTTDTIPLTNLIGTLAPARPAQPEAPLGIRPTRPGSCRRRAASR